MSWSFPVHSSSTEQWTQKDVPTCSACMDSLCRVYTVLVRCIFVTCGIARWRYRLQYYNTRFEILMMQHICYDGGVACSFGCTTLDTRMHLAWLIMRHACFVGVLLGLKCSPSYVAEVCADFLDFVFALVGPTGFVLACAYSLPSLRLDGGLLSLKHGPNFSHLTPPPSSRLDKG